MSQNHPYKVTLEKGKNYAYCMCGKSANLPFCNGSHKGSSVTPKVFVADKDGDAFLCGCGKSGNKPFCDGTHKKS